MVAAEPTPETIAIVKSTVPILRENLTEVITRFYENLFSTYPELKKQFNMDRHRGGTVKEENGIPKQVAALGGAVISYAKNIDRVEVLLPVVERISHKHVSRGVSAAQYDKIGECLLRAMKDILEEAITEDIHNAWAEAYGFLASVFINMETKLTEELSEKAGYSGFVPMSVVGMETDEDGSKRLSLKSEEFGTPQHGPGQYVAVVIEKEGLEPTMTSMATVGEDEENTLWIYVPDSQEESTRYLLDVVELGSVIKVSVPCGKVK